MERTRCPGTTELDGVPGGIVIRISYLYTESQMASTVSDKPREVQRLTTQLQRLQIDRQSIAQVVYDAIRAAIVDKTLPPGSPISEAQLARDLNVSKTPVREALLRLREIHLVEADGNRRLYVIKPSLSTMTSAYEARRTLEAGTAALAASRAGHEQHVEIQRTAERSLLAAQARDGEDFRRWDRSFHFAVAEASASPHLVVLAKNSLVLTDALRARDVTVAGDSVECSREHVAIATAIENGDQEEARRLAVEHVDHVSRNVLAAYGTDHGGPHSV